MRRRKTASIFMKTWRGRRMKSKRRSKARKKNRKKKKKGMESKMDKKLEGRMMKKRGKKGGGHEGIRRQRRRKIGRGGNVKIGTNKSLHSIDVRSHCLRQDIIYSPFFFLFSHIWPFTKTYQ